MDLQVRCAPNRGSPLGALAKACQKDRWPVFFGLSKKDGGLRRPRVPWAVMEDRTGAQQDGRKPEKGRPLDAAGAPNAGPRGGIGTAYVACCGAKVKEVQNYTLDAGKKWCVAQPSTQPSEEMDK